MKMFVFQGCGAFVRVPPILVCDEASSTRVLCSVLIDGCGLGALAGCRFIDESCIRKDHVRAAPLCCGRGALAGCGPCGRALRDALRALRALRAYGLGSFTEEAYVSHGSLRALPALL